MGLARRSAGIFSPSDAEAWLGLALAYAIQGDTAKDNHTARLIMEAS